MTDELELDLNENNQEEIISRKDKKINSLSEKVSLTAKERDELAKAKEEEAKARAAAEKERDFFKGFNKVSTKYPGATDYQDKILEKVNSGYEMEDATIAILAKEGKYNPAPPVVEKERAAGGSASTAMKGGDSKSPEEMSQEERMTALKELEAKGELSL